MESVTVPEYVPNTRPDEFTVTVIVLVLGDTPTGFGEADAASQLPPYVVLETIDKGKPIREVLPRVTVWLGGEKPRIVL